MLIYKTSKFVWLSFFLMLLPLGHIQAQGASLFTQTEPAPGSIISAVRRANKILDARLAEIKKAEKKPKVVAKKTSPLPITLAVWNKTTDSITLVSGVKTGKKLDIKSDFSYPITITFDNGVNSQYLLPEASNSLVVGEIYPVLQEQKLTKKRVQYILNDVVYVPYSSAFYVPEVLASGSDYLSYIINDVLLDLRTKKIRSVAFGDKLLADVIDPYLIKSIAIIEHSDSRIFNQDNPERSFGAFLVTMALNHEDSYSFSVSTAGARGLVQFIPSTYNRLVKRRPELGLMADFKEAMMNHFNAIKAQVALLDLEISELPDSVQSLIKSDPVSAAQFLAAAYNGGTPRVNKAIAAFGLDWSASKLAEIAKLNSRASTLKYEISVFKKKLAKLTGKEATQLKKTIAKDQAERDQIIAKLALYKKASLRTETVMYVVKLKKVYNMLSSGYFATPNAPSGALPTLVQSQPASVPNALAAEPGSVPGLILPSPADATVPVAPVPASGQGNPICFPDGGCVDINVNATKGS